MLCEICGSEEASSVCIMCEKKLCEACIIRCDVHDKDICIWRAGDIIIHRCSGIHCPTHAIENLIFTCKGCGIKFCKTPIGEWCQSCPSCKDYICGNCYNEHIKTCTEFYDKEEALDKLYNLIEGDKGEK